jgi:hypothetical protein
LEEHCQVNFAREVKRQAVARVPCTRQAAVDREIDETYAVSSQPGVSSDGDFVC